MKQKREGSKSVTAKTPNDIGRILGLTPGDIALMKYKAELSHLAVKSIRESGLALGEIVKRSGVARSKVSAIKKRGNSLCFLRSVSENYRCHGR